MRTYLALLLTTAVLVTSVLRVCAESPAIAVGEPGTAKSEAAWRDRVRAEIARLPAPAVPKASGNPIDAFLVDWWSQHKLVKPARTDDSTFLRRVQLDLVGLLATQEATKAFLADTSPDKRAKLIERLLADREAYAEHWMTFWNDLLRNDEQNFILVTRYPITAWLYRALIENRPYDRFAAELINPPDPESAGFIKGLDWEFSSSVSDITPMQAAQSTAQVFQGVNLKCASCHDHFSREWKLTDSWGLASFFTNEQLQIHRCDKATGQQAAPKFLFASLGAAKPEGDAKSKLATLARMVTCPSNPRFAKVIVNRMFHKLMGRGLITELDDVDAESPFKSELLDYLAYDFMRHDYDLKYLLRTIVSSETYQLVSNVPPANEREKTFSGPLRRRLTSEQFLDAMAMVTGHWPAADTMKLKLQTDRIRAWRHRQPSRLSVMLGRPPRDVICSTRPENASMLQSLELVNGQDFRGLVVTGAKKLMETCNAGTADPGAIASVLAYRACCRPPTEAELHLAKELFAEAGADKAEQQAAFEDLLWITLMSPEFVYLN